MKCILNPFKYQYAGPKVKFHPYPPPTGSMWAFEGDTRSGKVKSFSF